MKAFTFVFVFLMVGAAAFMYLDYSHKKGNSSNPGMVFTGSSNAMASLIKSRKLEDNSHSTPTLDEVYAGDMNLEDYRPIDPVPSPKAKIHHGTILRGPHGTMPYIPRPAPSPPSSHPKHGGFP
ncbi:Hypothetical predicted protein [Olea europaea subsp. europaea]|uniref:Uncharacterized protein n=1 Tax=Olea europaea subsp. europaea TaxID=158383 RepID=A0A8S0R6P8_OLEEU|nr:Hypothetical predicted protein [Olea europaea subsp. europaea]